ncbi:hypothetical protein PINS_up001889 [Pythium insidiosum]|nr:hypothetical protein PINS_up001889 [Pythium insidiosum]
MTSSDGDDSSSSSDPSSNSDSDAHSTASAKNDSAKKTTKKSSRANSMDDVDEIDRFEAEKFKQAVQGDRGDEHGHGSDDDEDIGPKPLVDASAAANAALNYGKALRPGEGEAIAQYVQKNMRIPRRGEVGWSGQEIENLESLGYVMSGSRHKRMNAVRLRKENQVYTAEEKRALALINFEEKQQRREPHHDRVPRDAHGATDQEARRAARGGHGELRNAAAAAAAVG